MAKSSIGRGQFRGKLGGDVYAVRNGQQIIRSYQPVVANPKSALQVDQRQKGNLAGKISSVVKADLIAGLSGGSKSGRRSRFLKILLDSITLQNVNSVRSAVITPDKVLFSEGVPQEYVIKQNQGVVIDGNTLSVVWQHTTNEYQENFTKQLLVVLLFILANEAGTVIQRKIFTYNNSVSLNTDMLNFSVPAYLTGYTGVAYAWGIPIVGNAGDAWQSGDLNGDSAMMFSSSGLRDLSAYVLADSVFLGSADLEL